MADRRRSFRFWTRRTPSPPPTARPSAVTSTTAPPTLKTTNSTPATKPAAQSQPVTASTLESPPISRQPTTTSPPTTKSQIPPLPPLTNSTPTPEKSQTTSRQPTTTATPPPPAETLQNPTSPRTATLDPPPPIEKQTATQPTNSTSTTRPTVESPSPVSRRPTTSTSPPSTISQTKPPTPTNSTPTPEKSQTTATPPPPAETSSKTPQSPTSPRTLALDPPPVEKQTTTQPTTTTLTSSIDEPKISSPSTPTTKSPNSSKPIASPSRPTPQSRSPPPSFPSPSRPAKPITSSSPSRNSKTPSTPQRAPQPRSPSRLTSKQLPPNSPSKESRQIAQTARASNEKDAKPATTQQEPQINSVEETNEVNEISPSKSTTTDRKSDPTTIIYEHGPHIELKANPEETKDVMEVAEATKTEEASEETKKEVNDFFNPKPAEVQTEKHEVREREEGLDTNNTTSQPNKISTNSHNEPAPTIEQHISLNKDIREDISTFVNQTVTGDPRNATNEKNVSIITLAGENRGASMQMGPTSKEGPVHIHRGYKKVNSHESGETNTDEEGNFKGKQSKDAKATEDQPTEAYVNNNAQGINNSIVFNASIAERDPGVHMIVTHIPKEQMWPAEKKMSPLEPRKAEFNISRAEKLTYEEPTVRRRCLRGLFMETSDSDQENSEKPRRHGCRVGCKLKEKENGIDVL